MRKILFLLLTSGFTALTSRSQSVAINTTSATANSSSILDITSTTKGMLIPRMTTTQKNGISTPATGLMVYDTDLSQFYFYNGSAWTAITASTNYWTLSGGNIYNNSGTNVGIGTVSPNDKLEVNGNMLLTGTGTIYTGAGTTNMTIHSGDGIGSGGTMTIRGGNAGISSGGAGGDITIQAGANLPAGGAGYGGLGVPGVVNILGSYGYNTVGGAINIIAGATSCWTLTGNSHADVNIQGGTDLVAADAASINVQGGGTIGVGCPTANANGGNLIIKSGIGTGTGTQGTIQLLNGNVGIGTSAPSSKLEVCGNTRIIGTLNVSSTLTSSSGITCPSDIRYKNKISPILNASEKLLQLNGVSYYWKVNEFPDMNFNNQQQIGFIAQEVEKIFPQMVFTDDKGFKSIDYSRLTPVLVETIKEQERKIDEITARLNDLEKKMK